jgi:beta-1,4-N-acetylglucosaminyltransferase
MRDISWAPLPFEQYGVTPRQHYLMLLITLSVVGFNIIIARLSSLTQRAPPRSRAKKTSANAVIVLGSGGHTSEMLNILRQTSSFRQDYNRIYIISSGDGFSASKANAFEKEVQSNRNFKILTVRRARRVHQSFWTAPLSTLLCLADCTKVLYQNPSDIIITNGPGTGVCVVLASIILRFFFVRSSSMRTIFIESWARVRTLSLSGKILKYFVDRFVVQWPQLVRIQGADTVEYAGPLVR